jgi:hypothetical protein
MRGRIHRKRRSCGNGGWRDGRSGRSGRCHAGVDVPGRPDSGVHVVGGSAGGEGVADVVVGAAHGGGGAAGAAAFRYVEVGELFCWKLWGVREVWRRED